MNINELLSEHRTIAQQIKELEDSRDAVRASIAEYVAEHGPVATDTDDVVMTPESYRSSYPERAVVDAIKSLYQVLGWISDVSARDAIQLVVDTLESAQKTTVTKSYLRIKHK